MILQARSFLKVVVLERYPGSKTGVAMLLISSYLPVSRSVKCIYTPQFKSNVC